MTQILDYHDPPRAAPPSTFILVALPVAAGGLAFASLMHYSRGEPFWVFVWADLAFFAGVPVAIAACLAAWCVLARRRRLRWFVALPVVGWLLLTTHWAVDTLRHDYFTENWYTDPWSNHPFRGGR